MLIGCNREELLWSCTKPCHPQFVAPIAIEYGSGNGSWLAQRAQQDPTYIWLGVEKKIKRALQLHRRLETMPHAYAVCGEALYFTKTYLNEGSVDQVFINFSDPWPKNRHAKNRLMSMRFVELLAYVMKSNAMLTFVSDDLNYVEQTASLLFSPFFSYCHAAAPFYTLELENYGTSFFHALWQSKDKPIYYLRVKKI